MSGWPEQRKAYSSNDAWKRLFSALYVNLGKWKLDLGMLSLCWSSACEELETGCRMKMCTCGRAGGVRDGD